MIGDISIRPIINEGIKIISPQIAKNAAIGIKIQAIANPFINYEFISSA